MKKKEEKKMITWKTVLSGIVVLIIILGTIMGALAFSIDEDDEIYVRAGDSLQGVFVVENFVEGTILKSNMEWVSLDGTKYVSEKAAMGSRFVDNNYVFYYWVNIPVDADVGVVRGTIEVKAGEQVKYLNVKISVQNSLVDGASGVFHNPKARIPIILVFVGLMAIFIILLWIRLRVRR